MHKRKPPRTLRTLLDALPLDSRVAWLRRELEKATGRMIQLRDRKKFNAAMVTANKKHRAKGRQPKPESVATP